MSLSCQVLLFVVVSFVVNGLVLITVSLFTIRKIWVSLSYHEICTVVMKFFWIFSCKEGVILGKSVPNYFKIVCFYSELNY